MSPLTVHVDRPRLERLLRGAVSVTHPTMVFRISGPGTVDCLQGLLTNDLAGAGVGSLSYTALLTPKGMIVTDLWAVRLDTEVLLVGPLEGRGPALETFRRSLPPRLARLEDLTDTWQSSFLYGDRTEAVLADAHLIRGMERPGAARPSSNPDVGCIVASGTPRAPFRTLLVGPADTMERAATLVLDHGMTRGSADDYHAARILAGWPALGLEIGDKTLLQEARLDQLEGVSFTKGCFLGQETVARIHFRGRTQRVLRGVDWLDLQLLDGAQVRSPDRELGRIHSILVLPDRRIGLAMLRREADVGDAVEAGGREARIVPLPFDRPDRAA